MVVAASGCGFTFQAAGTRTLIRVNEKIGKAKCRSVLKETLLEHAKGVSLGQRSELSF